MKGKKKNSEDVPADKAAKQGMPKQPGKKQQVCYDDVPVTPPPGQKIHPRQTPPPLPKGAFVPDENPSPPMDIE